MKVKMAGKNPFDLEGHKKDTILDKAIVSKILGLNSKPGQEWIPLEEGYTKR